MTEIYLWESNGGCPRCDAMDGYHFDEEPTRPHPYCDCEIELIESENGDECYTIDIGFDSFVWEGPDDPEAMERTHPIEVGYHFEIECWHGGGVSGSAVEDFDAEFVFEFNNKVELEADGWPVMDYDELEEAIRERLTEQAEEICHCNDMPPVDNLVS